MELYLTSIRYKSLFSLWYLRLQIAFLKCYGISLIYLKSQLQYSTEIEKRKENRLLIGYLVSYIHLDTKEKGRHVLVKVKGGRSVDLRKENSLVDIYQLGGYGLYHGKGELKGYYGQGEFTGCSKLVSINKYNGPSRFNKCHKSLVYVPMV